MESTPKRKNAKTWHKTYQNNPIRQPWRHANRGKKRNVNKPQWRCDSLSKTRAHDAIRPNINKPPKQYQQGAVLSRTESSNLIGYKINKVGCFTSVSHKHKHVPVKGRKFLNQKVPKVNLQRTEVSLYKESQKRSDEKGDDISPGLVLSKSVPSRLIVPSKVRNQKKGTDIKISKSNICLNHKALLGTMMTG